MDTTTRTSKRSLIRKLFGFNDPAKAAEKHDARCLPASTVAEKNETNDSPASPVEDPLVTPHRDDDARKYEYDIISFRTLPHDSDRRKSFPSKGINITYEDDDASRNSSEICLPNWFLDHCVQTVGDLANSQISLDFKDSADEDQDLNVASPSSPALYVVDPVLYEPLSEVIRHQESVGTEPQRVLPSSPSSFRFDAVHVFFPTEYRAGDGRRFINVIAQHFARQANADLITLSVEELDDLAECFGVQRMNTDEETKSRENAPPYDISSLSSTHDEDTQSLKLSKTDILRVLKAPDIKRRLVNGSEHATKKHPLVVHIPEARQFWDVLGDASIINLQNCAADTGIDVIWLLTTHEAKNFTWPPLTSLKRKTKRHRQSSRKLKDPDIFDVIAIRPRDAPICLAPVNDKTQRDMLEDDHNQTRRFYYQRKIQRLIRREHPEHRDMSLLQPFANWEFIHDTFPRSLLNDENAYEEEIDDLLCLITSEMDENAVKNTIIRQIERRKALDQSCEPPTTTNSESYWANYPLHVQNIIRYLEQDHYHHKWEKRFLDLLVDPKTVEEGWQDIVLRTETRNTIEQLLRQPSQTGVASYGILKRGRIGGSLLYGAPGTGKTHLARVLARESNSTMISVSAADIVDKYVGETEKAIKGLFSLGRMVAPSILFIDEADALFQSRTSTDKSWERSQRNQLLQEMDGLKKSSAAPFVLLATNFPHELDQAVLRRVPSRVHLGLPLLEARHRIFQVCLRDETLAPNLDLLELAERSRGYTGSDIQNLCVQAALICDVLTEEDSPRRLLGRAHFLKAFDRNAATVSTGTLSSIKSFAKQFDPTAFKQIIEEESQLKPQVPRNPSTWRTPSDQKVDGGQYCNMEAGIMSLRRQEQHKDIPITALPGFTPHGCDEHPVGRVEELEDSGYETTSQCAPLQFGYKPLPPGNKWIRVLKIKQRNSNIERSNDDPVECSLYTVSLEDWTLEYGLLSQYADQQGLSKLPTYRLAQWNSVCVQNDTQARFTNGGKATWQENFDKTWKRFERSNDYEINEMDRVSPRYTWGDYIALSYVWGDAIATREILLDGHPFAITPNLYEILLHLRESYEVTTCDFYVWIDAICINQADLVERANEVKKMRIIYSQCFAVRVWLGNPEPEHVAELISVHDLLKDAGDPYPLGQGLTWKDIEQRGFEDAIWSACVSLANAPYWERLWTAQEFLLAPSISCWYGEQAFKLTDIAHLNMLVALGITRGFSPTRTFDKNKYIRQKSNCAQRITLLRPAYHGSEPDIPSLHIVDLLHIAQGSKARDPRDKVYGLLALLEAETRDRITVNYDPSCSAEDTYIAFAMALLQSQGKLNVLARVRADARFGNDLPSWVPNLAAECDLTANPNDARYRNYDANQGLATGDFGFSTNNRLLHCSGFVVDAVQFLGATKYDSFELGATMSTSCAGPGTDIDSAESVGRWTASRTFGRASTAKHTRIEQTERSALEWKLAVARVLLQNSDFDFNDEFSIMDIPWVPQEQVEAPFSDPNVTPSFRDAKHYFDFPAEDRYWPRYHAITGIGPIFHMSLFDNEDFLIGGKPLRSYFPPFQGDDCPDPEKFWELSLDLYGGSSRMRLLTTASGLLGSGPRFAQIGDVIAVLADCDMPMVLRPRLDDDGMCAYQVVGSCFVEGLMKGEVALGLKDGHYKMERLTLC